MRDSIGLTESVDSVTTYDKPTSSRIQNGAKTGAVGASNQQLAWLNEVWLGLTDDARTQILGIARVNVSTVDAEN